MKNISTNTPVRQHISAYQPTSSNDSCTDAADRALQVEKEAHTKQSQERIVTFENILCNNSLDCETWKPVMTGMFGIFGAILSTAIYTLIPVHNVIENPQYWYEGIFQAVFVFYPIYSLNSMYRCSIYTNIKYIRTYRHFFALYIMVALTGSIGYAMIYIIWTHVFNYQHPIPFIGILLLINAAITNQVTLWYSFPGEWRQKQWLRKRLKFAILTSIYCSLVTIPYSMIAKIFITLSGHYQWVAAIFLPLVREFNTWVITKLACKSSDGNETCQTIACTQDSLVTHSLFVSYTVGSIANFATSTLIIGTDFLINVFLCLKTIYLYHNDEIGISKPQQIELLQTLVLSEMVELIVPFCYLVCFIMAYYGPNANIIGNILNSYWHFTAVEDIGQAMKCLCMFFFVDFLSLVICTIFLRCFCQIRLYKVYLVLQNEFGWLFNVSLALQLNGYFATNLIGFATDLTLRFQWIDGEYNYTESIATNSKNN